MHVSSYSKLFLNILFLLIFVATLVVPQTHSHEHSHEEGCIYHNLSKALNHDHSEVFHDDNLFALANSVEFSKHNHATHQHSHSFKKQALRSTREICRVSLSKLSPLPERNEYCIPNKTPSIIPDDLALLTCCSQLEFILVTTSLPPPVA